MQVAILGPLDVRGDDGARLDVAGGRLRALLVRLALDAGRPVSLATLVDAVWADQPPADAANALQTLVSRLRRALGDAALVAQSPAGYRLALDPEAVDAHRFEALALDGAAALRAGDAGAAAATLAEALQLWRGPALADVSPSTALDAARLHDLRLSAQLDRVEADIALGRAAAVVAELETLTAAYPLHERVAALWVSALAGSGRPADALAGYERVRARLADELGIDPSAQLQAVHLAVLRGEGAGPDPATRRTNLRAQLTSFVGRDAEVARIGKSLEEYRLVTLVGPGGAGKTRLASEAVSRIVDSVPDGVWFVELASVTDAADLAQTVLGSLGLREVHLLDRPAKITARDALSRLLDGLADKRAVIVLDNCEHLVEGSARLADTLLARCPQLRILTTSREPLGIFGESLLVVAPLGQPAFDCRPAEALEYPAVRLFADRAAAVVPDFQVDAATVATVIEIVRRLDGLPLAIELAAARLRTLPLSEIAARLSDRFRLLTGGSRTALPRHRTLRAVVEWSWELLTASERTLAERMAVFPSGAQPAAARAVCADPDGRGEVAADEVPDLLASLVDKSLLQSVEGSTRLRMLETIREYGTEQVAARGELLALRAAHADYFTELMREAEPHLIRREQVEWLALIAAERDNLLAALRFRCDVGDAGGALDIAVSMSGLAMLLGEHADVANWVAEALAVPGDADPGLRAVGDALYLINSMSSGVGVDSDAMEASTRRLGEVAQRLEAVDVARHPLVGLLKPAVAMFAGEDELMRRYNEEAMAGPDPWVAAAVQMFRANLAENNGDLEQMRVDAVESIARFRALGERWGLGGALRTIGMVHTLDGELDAAHAAYAEAMELMHEMGSREDEAYLLIRMADLAVRRGELAGARDYVARAQAAAEGSGSPMEASVAMSMRADIDWLMGDPDSGRLMLAAAMRKMAELPASHPAASHVRAIVLAVAGRIAVRAGEFDSARDYLTEAYTSGLTTKDQPIQATVGVMVAGLALELGAPERAAELLGAADAVRGAPDPTASEVAALRARLEAGLGPAAFATAYERGRTLPVSAASAQLDPSTL